MARWPAKVFRNSGVAGGPAIAHLRVSEEPRVNRAATSLSVRRWGWSILACSPIAGIGGCYVVPMLDPDRGEHERTYRYATEWVCPFVATWTSRVIVGFIICAFIGWVLLWVASLLSRKPKLPHSEE